MILIKMFIKFILFILNIYIHGFEFILYQLLILIYNVFRNTRYYMCSGAILTRLHVITSATCLNQVEVNE
jgi:hypothetical protein